MLLKTGARVIISAQSRFFAQFLEKNIRKEIVEKSLFEKIDNMWFYIGT